MKNFFLYLTCLLLMNKPIYATSWPIFLPPDIKLLLALNYIDVSKCAAGQGKLVDRASINISTYLCKNFCPREWYWITESDDTCHDLATDFNWQSNEIIHIHGSDGTISYSQITMSYGSKNSNKPGNKIVFNSTPNDHWFCIEIQPLGNSFTCASDI